jgi:hypothetical protein
MVAPGDHSEKEANPLTGNRPNFAVFQNERCRINGNRWILIPPFPGSSLGVLNVVLRLILNVGSRLRQSRIADSLKFTLALQRHEPIPIP